MATVPSLPAGAIFSCDLEAVLPKSDLATLEHPLFSLATRPDRRVLRYEHDGARIEITPSVKGRATIHDKDVLIYCVSQLMAAINAGRAVGRTLTLTAHDLLRATGRETSGDAYRRLREAFERLAGTRIVTNIAQGGEEITTGFGLIEAWRIVRTGAGGRMREVRVTLSDWLYRAVLSRRVLTLSPDYFGIRKPLERRLYEICRKHCGRQSEWKVGLETMHLKTGSASPLRVFRARLREAAEAGRVPDYEIGLEDDLVTVRRVRLPGTAAFPVFSPRTLERARELAPGADVYALEAEWRAFWDGTGRPRLAAPAAAFLGWVRARRP